MKPLDVTNPDHDVEGDYEATAPPIDHRIELIHTIVTMPLHNETLAQINNLVRQIAHNRTLQAQLVDAKMEVYKLKKENKCSTTSRTGSPS